jgi:hypothetical protein
MRHRHTPHVERLLRHVGQHMGEREVDGRRAVARVANKDAAVASDAADARVGRVFARADGVKERYVFFAQQQGIVLLRAGGWMDVSGLGNGIKSVKRRELR